MVLGTLQWECLAFFVEWSLNFLKFILFSSVVSFFLKGCEGTFTSTRKVAGFRIVGRMGGPPPPPPRPRPARPGWLLSAGGSQNESEKNGLEEEGFVLKGLGGGRRERFWTFVILWYP